MSHYVRKVKRTLYVTFILKSFREMKMPDKLPSDLGTLLVLGTSLAAWLTGGVMAGHYFTQNFGYSPWGLIAGFLLGVAGCVYSVIRAVRSLESILKNNGKRKNL